ncbi:MAG: hypothetical protein ABI867_23620 [Kofleriaceae bacterium]
MRIAATATIVALVATIACVLAPLRELSGDTVPGRIGGVVLRCAGEFDLNRVDWVRRATERKRMYYFLQRDALREVSSVFGPAPSVIMAIALLDYGEGDTIGDVALRSRERGAAAVCLGLAVAFLVLAAAARASLRYAALTGVVAAASFAGAATLGQNLWQASTALPWLAGGLAALAWKDRYPRIGLATPALLAIAVMLRPTIAPTVLGLGLAWAIGARDRRTWILATVFALVAVSPLVVWNVVHLGTPFPVGQWHANTRAAGDPFSPSNFGTGIAGLVVSPARGLVWFAPIAIVGIVRGFASRQRPLQLIAGALVLQLVVMAAHFRWHGGLAYGPRFLAEATWIGIWLALGVGLDAPARRPLRWLAGVAIAVTIGVGQLGLWCFENEQWETRRRPETDPAAFWDFGDSPIAATLSSAPTTPVMHAPNAALQCFDTGFVGSR